MSSPATYGSARSARKSGPLRRLAKYLAIGYQFARIGVIRKSQFRVEFLSQVIMDVIWYTTNVLVFEILLDSTPDIAGWSLPDLRVFLGFLFVTDAFMMVWLGQAWHFGRELKDGKLDPIRVRPASAIFLYFFQRFSLEGTLNMAIAMGYLVYALLQAEFPAERHVVETLGLVLFGTAVGWWGRSVLSVLFSVAEFYFLYSDIGHALGQASGAVGSRPLDIFTRRVRQFFVLLLPVGTLAYFPAALVLGKIGPLAGAFTSLWLLGFGILVFRFWNRSFQRYESAMS